MATQFLEYFSHGSEYTGELEADNVPRSKACNSCAFTSCRDTVRPADISLYEMIEQGDQFDVFYCHEPDSDGRNKICATWLKLFSDIKTVERAANEVNAILAS